MGQQNVNNIVTTDATPQQVLLANLAPNTAIMGLFMVQGIELATGDHAAFAAMHSGRRLAGNLVATGVASVLHAQKTAGAAAWTAAFSQGNGSVAVTVTGQAGKTITWQIMAITAVQEALAS